MTSERFRFTVDRSIRCEFPYSVWTIVLRTLLVSLLQVFATDGKRTRGHNVLSLGRDGVN